MLTFAALMKTSKDLLKKTILTLVAFSIPATSMASIRTSDDPPAPLELRAPREKTASRLASKTAQQSTQQSKSSLEPVSQQADLVQQIAGPSSFRVTPTSLRVRLLDENTSVLIGLNTVYQAKEQVNIARANLLPSLNVGAVITGLATGPGTFAVSAISVLLPFLLPSNWYNLEATEYQMLAYGYAFNLVQLNTYASGYALYNSVLGDIAIRAVQAKQYANLDRIRKIVADRVQVGTSPVKDLYQANAKAELSRTQLSQTDQVIAQEKAAFRKLLSLPLKSKISFENQHPAPLPIESQSAQTVLDKAYTTSPEYRQIRSLIAAAKNSTWSQKFSFLTGSSMSFSTTGSETFPSFSSLRISGSAGIGFDYYPSIRLSHLHVDQLRLRSTEIRLEMSRIIESTLASLRQAKIQYEHASLAESESDKYFQAELQSYQVGTTDLMHVLEAENTLTSASITRARARVELDNQRVNLYRIMRSGQFATIPGCQIDKGDNDDFSLREWFKGFFRRSNTRISVDQMCRPYSSTVQRRG